MHFARPGCSHDPGVCCQSAPECSRVAGQHGEIKLISCEKCVLFALISLAVVRTMVYSPFALAVVRTMVYSSLALAVVTTMVYSSLALDLGGQACRCDLDL